MSFLTYKLGMKSDELCGCFSDFFSCILYMSIFFVLKGCSACCCLCGMQLNCWSAGVFGISSWKACFICYPTIARRERGELHGGGEICASIVVDICCTTLSLLTLYRRAKTLNQEKKKVEKQNKITGPTQENNPNGNGYGNNNQNMNTPHGGNYPNGNGYGNNNPNMNTPHGGNHPYGNGFGINNPNINLPYGVNQNRTEDDYNYKYEV